MELERIMHNSDESFFNEGAVQNSEEDENIASGEIEVDDISGVLDAKVSYNNKSTQIDSILNSLRTEYYYIPPFQRRYVWDKEKVAYLALSIIKNFPIPPMYVYVDKSSRKHVVLDGQQRMISIFLYFNDLTYTRSDNKINFREVSVLNEQLRNLENRIAEMKENGEKPKDIKAVSKEADVLSKKLFDKYGMKRWNYTINVSSEDEETMDISFSKFSLADQEFLRHKSMDVTVVECSDEHPEVTYAYIFKLLNSAGKNLGPQEIRNGIYWQSDLYSSLFDINSNNRTWRNIYGNLSIYSKDMEILLKVLSLAYYTRLEDGKIVITSSGFSWAKIMDQYSLISVKEDLSQDVEKLKKYLDSIKNYDSSIKCRKAVFEAIFVAIGKVFPEYDVDIDYEWLCEHAGAKFEKIESSRASVEDRLNKALDAVKEKYNV